MTESQNSDNVADRVAAAAVDLAGARGWRRLTLGDIALEAGVTLAELSRHYSCKPEILDGFERMIDQRMLAGATGEPSDDTPRDRVFDIVMSRFDALLPHRDGVSRIARELPFDHASGVVLALALPRSAAWMLAGAGLKLDGPLTPLRVAAITGLYLSIFRVWLDDRSEDMSKTMAALDRKLGQMGSFITGETKQAGGAARPDPERATPEQASDGAVESGGPGVD
jgi:AcrR family transcriptional regulator